MLIPLVINVCLLHGIIIPANNLICDGFLFLPYTWKLYWIFLFFFFFKLFSNFLLSTATFPLFLYFCTKQTRNTLKNSPFVSAGLPQDTGLNCKLLGIQPNVAGLANQGEAGRIRAQNPGGIKTGNKYFAATCCHREEQICRDMFAQSYSDLPFKVFPTFQMFETSSARRKSCFSSGSLITSVNASSSLFLFLFSPSVFPLFFLLLYFFFLISEWQ